MANLRPILFMGLLFLSYLMWVEWQKDYGPRPRQQPTTDITNTPANNLPIPGQTDYSVPSVGDLPDPDAGTVGVGKPTDAPVVMIGEKELLIVTTDVLEAGIDLVGGTLVSARLMNYPLELEVSEIKVNSYVLP
jgi:YidC/Oxa1 family membrane protein insertase